MMMRMGNVDASSVSTLDQDKKKRIAEGIKGAFSGGMKAGQEASAGMEKAAASDNAMFETIAKSMKNRRAAKMSKLRALGGE